MARPPLGETSMTAAERQRKHRARLRQEQADSKLSEQVPLTTAPSNLPRSPPPPTPPPPNGQGTGQSQGQDPRSLPAARDDLAWRDRSADLEPLHFRAWHALSTIETCTGLLRDEGRPAAALPATAIAILEKAAAGKPVEPGLLARVLEASEALSRQLAFSVLERFPTAGA